MSIYEFNQELHEKTLRDEERREGRREGRKEGRRDILRAMLERGQAVEFISEVTGEPIECIKELSGQMYSKG